jgi:hypothetical protein
LTLHGTADQVALGEWLVKSLDVATNGPADPNVGAPYCVSGTDDSDPVFYFTYAGTVQDLQEVATMIRTIAEIRGVAVYRPQKAVMIRGTAEQLAMAGWISSQLERHKPGQASDGAEFKLASGSENVMRVLWATTPTTIQEFQTMATALRTIAEIRRVFTYNKQQAIAVRGTAQQIGLANWLLAELDQPAHLSTPYTTAEGRNSVVRIFFLSPIPTPVSSPSSDPKLQKTATDVRTAANMFHVFTYPPTRAIAMRGTADQIAAAAKMLEGKLIARAQ